jgi:hypothetical protein
MTERWIAESAVVARPFLKVEILRLPSGGYAFLSAIPKEKLWQANLLRARAEGIPVPAYCYRDYGVMATIGRKRAVAQLDVQGFRSRGLAVMEPRPHLFLDRLSQPSRCRHELVLELYYVSAGHAVDHRHFRLTH